MRMAELHLESETIRGIGDNGPPSPIELSREAMADLSKFLTDTPVVETHQQAKQGALFVERARKSIQEMDDARKAEVSPLNEKVKAINERYRQVRDPFDNVLSELRRRLTDYTAREEAKRIREAELQRQAAVAAEQAAREAEKREQEAKQNATFGEVTDVAAAVIDADKKFSEFEKADRQAAIAERNIPVKLTSQLGGRALSMRTEKTLVLQSYSLAIKAIGPCEKIETAILSAARDYRKKHNKLPDGVTEVTERKI